MIDVSHDVDWLSQTQSAHIAQILHRLVGSGAFDLARLIDAIGDCTNLSELLGELEKHLPRSIQPAFCEQTAWLRTKAITDLAFVQRCQQAFIIYLGPITPLLIETLLKDDVELSQFDLIEALISHLSSRMNIETVRAQLHDTIRVQLSPIPHFRV